MNGQTWWILLDEYNLIFFSSISNIFVTLQRRCASLKKQKKNTVQCASVCFVVVYEHAIRSVCVCLGAGVCVCVRVYLSLSHTHERLVENSCATTNHLHLQARTAMTWDCVRRWLYTDYCGVKYKNMLWRILCVRLSTSTIKEKKKYISSLHPFELAPKISYLLG